MKKLLPVLVTAFFLVTATAVSAQEGPKKDTVKPAKSGKRKKGSKDASPAPAGIIINEKGTGKAHPASSSARKDSAGPKDVNKNEDPKPKND